MADTDTATAEALKRSAAAEEARAKQKSKPKGDPNKERQPFFFELSRLLVVAVNAFNGELACRGQTKPNGPWEPNWTPIAPGNFGAMAAGITGDGRVAVVAQPSAHTGLQFIDEAADVVGVQRWNRPVDLGIPAPGTAFGHLTMAYDVDARLEVFGTDQGQKIWWKYQNPTRIVQKTVTRTPPGTHQEVTVTVDEIAPPLTPWSNWIQLPGGLTQIAARRLGDGRIILFGINSEGHLYRCEQKSARALQASDWTGWVKMDDAATGVFHAMAPIADKTGAMNLFAATNGGQVLHARQSPPCCPTWTGWTTPGYIREGVQTVAAGVDGNDDIVLAVLDRTRVHQANYQFDAEAQEWSGWMPFATAGNPAFLALEYNADGRLTYFSQLLLAPPAFGGLYCCSQMAFDSTEWEFEWTELARDGIRQYVVVRDVTPPQK